MSPTLAMRLSRFVLALVPPLFGLGAFGCACGEEPPRPPPPLLAQSEVDPELLEASARREVEWAEPVRTAALEAGREALARNQCNRCHVIDDVPPAGRAEHCVSCHVFLDGLPPEDRRYRTLAERYGEETVQRYQRNIQHYLAAPDLTRVGARLRTDWIASFIAEPEDLRPMLDETMVRTRLSDADRLAIARYFAAVVRMPDPAGAAPAASPVPPRPSDTEMSEARTLFAQRACNTCHLVGNVALGRTVEELEAAGAPARMAPNLRFVRERMHPDVALQWILDPQSLHPTTSMPNLQLSAREATLLRDWLWHVDPELEPTPAPSAHALPPALTRTVSWEEVKEGVLGRICVHCHMNDHERDPGPGHVGGYGWPAAGLRMRTYESLVSGMPCEDPLLAPRGVAPVAPGTIQGERCSVLEPREPGGIPPLLAVMLLRHDEEVRDRVRPLHDHERPAFASDRPGMPMGLPSIPDEEIALVRAWIEQGCVGPVGVTGMPGIPDGFLVPDGPIAENRGCGVRAPSVERPEWASHPPPAFWHD
jgi:cbb3-type cytochrome oxidase cytochrome c subunit